MILLFEFCKTMNVFYRGFFEGSTYKTDSSTELRWQVLYIWERTRTAHFKLICPHKHGGKKPQPTNSTSNHIFQWYFMSETMARFGSCQLSVYEELPSTQHLTTFTFRKEEETNQLRGCLSWSWFWPCCVAVLWSGKMQVTFPCCFLLSEPSGWLSLLPSLQGVTSLVIRQQCPRTAHLCGWCISSPS